MEGHSSPACIAVRQRKCREASQSPLVTLAAVALAFVIMFTVNMFSGPPGSSSTGSAGPTAAPTTAAGPQQTTSATPSASETAEDSEFPEQVVHAGRTADGPAAIAVAVLGNQAAAYVCDGRNVESWFRGIVEGGRLTLKSKSGGSAPGGARRRPPQRHRADQERHTEVRDQRGE